MGNLRKSVAQVKKFLTSLVVLLIFLFPMVVSARWLRDMIWGTDPRKVFSQSEIAAFGQACPKSTETIRPFDEPLITITFDDGWESIYSTGLEVLENSCIETTQYILGGHFDDHLYVSEPQVKSLQEAGHEIASHTMTHSNLTKLPKGQMSWELKESDETLSAKFGDMREFASPLGASNDVVIEEIKKYYRSHRNTIGDPARVGDEDINVAETFDPYHINAYTISQDTTADDIRRLIDHTVKRKGWLVLTYHQVDDTDSYYAVNRQKLNEHLRIVKDSGVRAHTLGRVLDAIEQRSRP